LTLFGKQRFFGQGALSEVTFQPAMRID